jgi:tRNA-2-methylthio-N6-dimethylallyladenosine synthase
MAKTFFIETFGCQMNELDTEKIAGNLQHEGMEPVGERSEADVIILNTCSIRDKAVQKVYARLGEIKKEKAQRRNVLIGVVGCMAQLEGQRIFQKAPFVDLVAGPQKGHAMFRLLQEVSQKGDSVLDLRSDEDPEPLETAHVLRESSRRAGVTISEGCNRECAFCVVPHTRGRQRDRESSRIIAEVEDLILQGYVEIMLLGQTVNSYREPGHKAFGFAGLLRRLVRIPGLMRIRFTSPHPSEFDDDLFDLMTTSPQVCPHIHLPVQSGSDRVLVSMKRGYTRDGYLETVRRIRQVPRAVAISTDIMVGFPGESEKDFQDTLGLLDEVQYDSVFSFKYSPRPKTPAWIGQREIPEDEKGRRLQILQRRQNLIQYNKNAAFVGKVLDVLVDGHARSQYALTGRAGNNKIVNFDGSDDLIGRIVPVEITGFSANSLKGVWIK